MKIQQLKSISNQMKCQVSLPTLVGLCVHQKTQIKGVGGAFLIPLLACFSLFAVCLLRGCLLASGQGATLVKYHEAKQFQLF